MFVKTVKGVEMSPAGAVHVMALKGDGLVTKTALRQGSAMITVIVTG